jgi:hypothetical protein
MRDKVWGGQSADGGMPCGGVEQPYSALLRRRITIASRVETDASSRSICHLQGLRPRICSQSSAACSASPPAPHVHVPHTWAMHVPAMDIYIWHAACMMHAVCMCMCGRRVKLRHRHSPRTPQ